MPVSEVLNPHLWRSRYAYGLLRGDRFGQRSLAERISIAEAGESNTPSEVLDGIPTELIRYHLRVALSTLEVLLDYPMGVQVVKSTPVDEGLVLGTDYDVERGRLPFTQGETAEWYRIDLPGNIISIQRLRAFFFDQIVWEISDDDPNLLRMQHPRQGVAHIIPIQLSSLIVRASGFGLWETVWGFAMQSPIPQFWAVDYTTGPVTNQGQPGHIELVLAHWVAMCAALSIFGIDSVLSTYGVTSTSLSFDGLSRSISVPTNIHQAAVEAFEKLMELIDWKAMRTRKKGIRVIKYSH